MKKVIIFLFIVINSINIFATSELIFDSSAKPTSLILDGIDVLGSNSGFTLTYDDGTNSETIEINTLTQSGDEITVYNSSRSERFTFLVQSYDHHVAIHLVDTAGLGANPQYYHLQLKINTSVNSSISAYTLNDLMTSTERTKYVTLDWPYLWARPRADGSRGSVVLYNKTLTGTLMDNALAEIWATQAGQGHMVKPNVSSWTEADIMKWIDWYVDSFKKLSVISVHPESDADDLYEMINRYVIPNEPTKVFMFQTSWGTNGTYTTPRASVFPNGESDLRAYSDYLDSNGIMLHLKNMTPQVLPTMGNYITANSVDDRLMSWSVGSSNNAISATDTYIEYHGKVNVGYEDWNSNSKWETDYFQIGNEIVRVDSLANPSEGVWKLYGCQRAQKGTVASAHSAGETMKGLVSKWNNLNYQEDFDTDNSLGEEIIGEYAEFMNRMHSRHIHFDGTGLNNPPWYTREYTDYAYSKYAYPTTGSTVGGGGLKAHFEKKFSKVQAIIGMLNYFPVRIGPRLHKTGRKHTELSTSKLDMNFDIMDGITLGSRRVALLAGESGSKLSKTLLDSYGLTDYALKLFSYWKELAPVLTDADAEYIGSFFEGKYLNHYKGPVVLVLSKNEEGKYIFTPHRTLARTTGEDSLFVVHQEWSGIACWQSITTGTTMKFYNPNKAQTLRFYIKNDNKAKNYVDPTISIDGSGSIAVNGSLNIDEYLEYNGGDTVIVYDSNWNYQRTLPANVQNFIAPNDTFSVEVKSGSESTNIKTLFITLGTPYILTTNDVLADTSMYENPAIPIEGFKTSPSNILVTLGDKKSITLIKPTFTPSNATDQRVIWTSSDTSVAIVTKGGYVIPVGAGSATITATTKDGGFTAKTYINVLLPPTNLALSGVATQSSTYKTAEAMLAIDGNTNGAYNSGSVTHTNTEDNPWWQVDLGADYKIGDINIFGRTDDCCADRLSDYTLYVINSAGDTTYSEHFTTYPIAITNAGGAIGKIVKIQLNTTNALSLAEVEVFNVQDSTTSIKYESNTTKVNDQIKVYPNPVEDFFILRVAKDAGRYTVKNRDSKVVLTGKTTGNKTIVDATKLSAGVYIIEVGTTKTVFYKTTGKCDCPIK